MLCSVLCSGIWLLLDHYFLPDNPGFSAAMTHVIGIVLLSLMLCAQSVTLSGCILDGQTPTVELACITPNLYLRQFFDKVPRCGQVVASRMRSAVVVKEQTTAAAVQTPINVDSNHSQC